MSTTAAAAPPRLRLHYLDGLRGLAAFYVVLHHALMEVVSVPGWLPPAFAKATRWGWNGQIAVQIFIALSGYCLMMPVIRARELKGGWTGFIRRRAWRILPPYYAALIFSLAIIAFVPGMGTRQGLRWDMTLPAFTPAVLGSHLLLLQDLQPDWILKVSYPMWTIAQEWQIYFVFAFVLLPLWQRGGMGITLGFAWVVSVALGKIPGHSFTYAAPEFLFLFAVGMTAAAVNFESLSDGAAALRRRVPWSLLGVLFWAAYVALMLEHPELTEIHTWRLTFLAAGAMLCTLVSCTNAVQHERRGNLLRRFCEYFPVATLGTFSYSLYLVHAPILSYCTLLLHRRQVTGWQALSVEFLVAVPLAVIVAGGFHLVAERPFMRPRAGRTEADATLLPGAARPAVVDPLPG